MIGTGFDGAHQDPVKVLAVFDHVFDGGAEAFFVQHFGDEFRFSFADGGDLQVGATSGLAVTGGGGHGLFRFLLRFGLSLSLGFGYPLGLLRFGFLLYFGLLGFWFRLGLRLFFGRGLGFRDLGLDGGLDLYRTHIRRHAIGGRRFRVHHNWLIGGSVIHFVGFGDRVHAATHNKAHGEKHRQKCHDNKEHAEELFIAQD